MNEDLRIKLIYKTGIIGVATNISLALTKLIIGYLINSVSIMTDAINNFSDVLSSTITIAGIKFASIPADKEHPFGHGRAEYLSALLISVLIIFAGISAFTNAIKKLIFPSDTLYSVLSLCFLIMAIVVKYVLAKYTITMGRKTNSDSLTGSGKDAYFDVIITSVILIGAATQYFFNLSVDAYLGIIVSGFIIKSGIEMLLNTLSNILGKRVGADTAGIIKNEILTYKEVLGVYDIYLDSYGPNRYAGSVRIEVSDKMSASQIDELTRNISFHIYHKHKILLTCGIYSISSSPEDILDRDKISKYVLSQYGIIQIHGFHISREAKKIYFDIVVGFEVKDIENLIEKIKIDLTRMYPGYIFLINPDLDFSDAY